MPDFATRITTLVDAEAPPVDIEELVRELEAGAEIAGTSPIRRRATNWVVAVGAAVGVLLLIGVPLLIAGSRPESPPAHDPIAPSYAPPPTARGLKDPPRGAFVAGLDDLCEWFTEEEIAAVVEEAFTSKDLVWEGTVTIVERGPAAGDTSWDCAWYLEGTTAEGSTDNHTVSARVMPGGLPGDPDLVEIIEYTEDQPFERIVGVFFSGYPGVDEDIVVGPAMWTGFIFWVSGTDLAIEIGSSDLGGPGEPSVAIANTILENLRPKP